MSDAELAEFIRIGLESGPATPMLVRAQTEAAFRIEEAQYTKELHDKLRLPEHEAGRKDATLRLVANIIGSAQAPDRINDGRAMFYAFAVPVGNRGFLWPADNLSWNFGLRMTQPVSRGVIARSDQENKMHSEPKKEWLQFPIDSGWVLMNSLRVPKITQNLSDAEILIPDGLHYAVSLEFNLNDPCVSEIYSQAALYRFEDDGSKTYISHGSGHNHASALAVACLMKRADDMAEQVV